MTRIEGAQCRCTGDSHRYIEDPDCLDYPEAGIEDTDDLPVAECRSPWVTRALRHELPAPTIVAVAS